MSTLCTINMIVCRGGGGTRGSTASPWGTAWETVLARELFFCMNVFGVYQRTHHFYGMAMVNPLRTFMVPRTAVARRGAKELQNVTKGLRNQQNTKVPNLTFPPLEFRSWILTRNKKWIPRNNKGLRIPSVAFRLSRKKTPQTRNKNQ